MTLKCCPKSNKSCCECVSPPCDRPAWFCVTADVERLLKMLVLAPLSCGVSGSPGSTARTPAWIVDEAVTTVTIRPPPNFRVRFRSLCRCSTGRCQVRWAEPGRLLALFSTFLHPHQRHQSSFFSTHLKLISVSGLIVFPCFFCSYSVRCGKTLNIFITFGVYLEVFLEKTETDARQGLCSHSSHQLMSRLNIKKNVSNSQQQHKQSH